MTDEKYNTPPTGDQPATPRTAEAALSASDVDDLFRDLAALVDIQHIAVKQAPGRANAAPAPRDLVNTRLLLDQPGVHAVQLRYTYNDDLWIDTLTKQAGGYTLLRVQHA